MPKKKSKEVQENTPQASTTEPKPDKLYENLFRVIQQYLLGKSYKPLTLEELLNKLTLPSQHLPVLQIILKNLVDQGIIEIRNERYALKIAEPEVVTGTLRVHPRGFGFLQADNAKQYPQDIFIPKHLTQNAVDGDRVEVVVDTESVSEKGPEGKVVAITQRGRTHIAGIVRTIDRKHDVIAYVPLLGAQQRVVVQSDEMTLRIGDRLVMEVIEWGNKESPTYCRMSHHLGHISDPSTDIKASIEEFELRSDFPSKVVREAKDFGKQVTNDDIIDREDFRKMECFTIDPDTAKDFDDALTLKVDKKGYHLGVHIADVSHYVRPGSALDIEASQRCNSTYFPNFCLPMLPGELSENLCSLKANVNRLTVSVLMDIDHQGNLVHYRIVRGVIKSAKRFTYKEAKKVLDGEKTSPHKKTLQRMVELCLLLKKKRHERGSIEFAMPELVVIVDEKGVPQNTDYIAYDITHQMVEEFMLKANELVATHLFQQGKNLTYRIHEEPAEENLRDFATVANAFGYKLSDKPTPTEIQKLFFEALNTPYGQYLATSYIRRMRLAEYSAENVGHYGLGLTHYCHFTSPIRRYVDLVAHRLLFGANDDLKTLEDIARRCSDRERISAKAEASVVILKKLRLLSTLRQKDPYKEYEAIITRVKNFGFYFEVVELMLEGYFHVSELENDYFVYEENPTRLRGVNNGIIYSPGERINVMLREVDFILLESKWYLIAPKRNSVPKKQEGRKNQEKKKLKFAKKMRVQQRRSEKKRTKKAKRSNKRR